jgi:hypothetical protein
VDDAQRNLEFRIRELEVKVTSLSQREDICQVYLRYLRGLDRNDMELIRGAFWPDGQINYGVESWAGRDFFVELEQHNLDGIASQTHYITNFTMDIVGDVAHVESYMLALRRPRESQTTIVFGGRYVDRLDRRNGEWRIAVREFIPHCWIEGKSVLHEVWPQSVIEMGRFDRTDPSYRRPLMPRGSNDRDDGLIGSTDEILG